MKYLTSFRRGLLVVSLGLAGLPVWAGDDCEAPVSRWQSREALRQWAVAQGWQIKRLKIDDGCYELLGVDAQGRRFKAKVDPETLKVLKLKQDHHQRARERERDHDDGVKPAPLPASGTAPRRHLD